MSRCLMSNRNEQTGFFAVDFRQTKGTDMFMEQTNKKRKYST